MNSDTGLDITTFSLPVFAFYLFLAGSYLHDIFGCRLQHIMETSLLAKHITAVLLLFFLIVAVNPASAKYNIGLNIGITLAIYVWFLVTTRCPFPIMIFVIICLFVVYLLGYERDMTKGQSDDDDTKSQKLKMAQNVLGLTALGASLVGFAWYVFEKYKEFGSKFELIKFFFGHHLCKKVYS